MKPAWDKLAKEFSSSKSVTVADVDCTAAGQPLCEKVGVKGYPTIKYYLADNRKPFDYNGGREFGDLKKFTTKTFKAGCNVETGDDCSEEQKTNIAKCKPMSLEELKKTVEDAETEEKRLVEERTKFTEESKEKIKAYKDEEAEVQLRIVLAGKFETKLAPPPPPEEPKEEKPKEEKKKKKGEDSEEE